MYICIYHTTDEQSCVNICGDDDDNNNNNNKKTGQIQHETCTEFKKYEK